jgi:hypothetical protein
MSRFFLIIISILFLSSCSGTGKNNLILSQELKSNDTQVFVKRETGFPGIAALIRVLLNGKEIGELGENERLSANTTEGEGSIAAHFTMIASIGANDYPITFKIKKGEKLFFVIKQTLGLMSTTLYIEKVDQDVFFKN